MKKVLFLILFFAAVSVFSANNRYEVQVTQSIVTQQPDYSSRKNLETMARKSAVKQYIVRLAPGIPENLIDKAVSEYSHFIASIDKIQERFTPLGADGSGELSAEFKVFIHHDKINNFLKENGFSVSGSIEFTVMEEPLALGQIQLHTAFGSDSSYFIDNYVTLQRRVRDAIIKKVSSFGFDVKLLDDNDLYREFRTKDSSLSGVYYDVTTKKFSRNNQLIDLVKQNNPNTIVLYYRFDALIYDPPTRTVRITLVFGMKDLNKNFTKSLGSSSFELVVNSTNKSIIMDEFAYCAETAVSILLNKEDAADRINKMAMGIRNSRNVSQGPLKIVINAQAFEAKNRKKLMYHLRKQLIAQKITEPALIQVNNNTITAVITTPQITGTDELYMEHIVPILEKFSEELDDSKVNYDNNTLTIKP